MAPNGKRSAYRFSHFEVHPDELEVRKQGIRLKLQEQPFRLLEALLERPGTLVTREELHARLWPYDTFVDFDHGLNAAAARLRQALGDSARLPRFIESVPRRGYRFIAPVEVVHVEAVNGAAEAPAGPAQELAAVQRRERGWRIAFVVATILIAIATAIWWLQSRDHPERVGSFKVPVTPPEGTTFVEDDPPALSPDGRFMAFTATDHSGESELWIRPMDEVAARRLEGTKGAAFPFWSPDSQSIAFFANATLNRVGVNGGLPKILCKAPDGRGGAWNRENTIVFAPSLSSPLYQVPATGGEPKALTALDASSQEFSHRWPFFLPDGRHFLYTVRTALQEQNGIYLGSLAGGRSSRLIKSWSNAMYAHDKSGRGYVLSTHDAVLVARPFDARALKITGPEFPVTGVYDRVMLEPLRADFSVSDTGILVYRAPFRTNQLTWFDRSGNRLRTLGAPGGNVSIALSPNEKEVAVGRLDAHTGRWVVWRVDAATGAAFRVTHGPADQFAPVWLPDGSRIVYGSTDLIHSPTNPDTEAEIREVGVDGGGDRLLLRSQNLKAPWSTDGRFVIYEEVHSGKKVDSWALPLRDGAKPMPLLQGSPNQRFAVFSPDAKWIAYDSDESGKSEIYVAPFTPGANPARKWMVSSGGGSHPQWSRDGKQIYYLSTDRRIMSVAVDRLHNDFAAGTARALFQSDIVPDFRAQFVVTADGQKFLIPSAAGEGGPGVAVVIVNWTPASAQ